MFARIKRLAKIAAAAFAFLLYVWFAAVRNLPWVKQRKRVRRQEIRAAVRLRGASRDSRRAASAARGVDR